MKNLIKIWPSAVSLLFVFLWSYAAISKTVTLENFINQLEQAPGLSQWAGMLAYSIIVLQGTAIFLLCYQRYRLWGLWISFGIVTAFAAYIALILHYSQNPPCTCIGLFEKMTWKGNLILNIGLMITALVGIISMRTGRDKKNEKDASFSE